MYKIVGSDEEPLAVDAFWERESFLWGCGPRAATHASVEGPVPTHVQVTQVAGPVSTHLQVAPGGLSGFLKITHIKLGGG